MIGRTATALFCAGLLTLALAPPAQAAASDPIFVFVPPPPNQSQTPPPAGYLDGPCGIGVDSKGLFYVSDYYHDTVDAFEPSSSSVPPPSYKGQLSAVDPLDGPCALAFDSSDRLYVNDFHRAVLRYGAFPSFGAPTPIAGAGVDETHPTGVAVDPNTGNVYVDERTYIGVYDSTGAPIEEGGQPLRIGQGTLEEGYGLAISRFASTAGYLYVPDAASKTVKVYDPAAPDKEDPVQTIGGPIGGFTSLRDAAVAVDWQSGKLYVVDDLNPALTEEPQAQVEVFTSAGLYLGVLKYRIVDALPAGLAVDNSANPTQGHVYVTSGNTEQAGVYAYGSNAQVGASLPPSAGLSLQARGEGQVTSSLGGIDCTGACEAQIRSGAEVTLTATPKQGASFAGWSGGGCEGMSPTCTLSMDESRSVSASFASSSSSSSSEQAARSSSISQQGNLRLNVEGKLSPKRLPRQGSAPIAVSVGWSLSTTDGSAVPSLQKLGIEINRHGRFDYAGLPTCPIAKIQPASSSRALSNCRSSLVGEGSFSANIALRGQEAYETKGRLLVFNGRQGKKPVLFGQIYSPHPFATSFVIPFQLKTLSHGTYGSALEASMPKGLAAWGNLTGIQMTLSRRYFAEGERRSYISAGCPAPKGASEAVFPLARTSFAFAGGARLGSTLSGTCRARG